MPDAPTSSDSSIFGIPLNRIVAFVGPYISLVAGGVAAWLAGKVNLTGILGIGQDQVESAIAAGLAGVVGAGLTWAGHQQWLHGHHIELAKQAVVLAPEGTPAPGVYDPSAFDPPAPAADPAAEPSATAPVEPTAAPGDPKTPLGMDPDRPASDQ